MTIGDYLAIARRQWLTILGMTVIGGLVALAISLLTPPTYTATAQNFVSIGGSSRDSITAGSTFAQQRVKSYVNVVDSPSVLAPVVSRLQLDMTPQQLAQHVSAANPPQTVLLDVTVTGDDPQWVADVANAVAIRYADLLEILETPNGSSATVKVSPLIEATPPGSPAAPRTRINVALGLLLGLGAGLGWALLRQRLDVTVRSLDAAADAAGAPGLGIVTTTEDPLAALSPDTESFRTIRTNLAFADVDHPPQVIAVVSPEAAEGKTTTAVNLAIAIAAAGRSVCLVEADLRKPEATSRLGVASSVGLTSVLVGAVDLDAALVPWRRGTLTLLPAGEVPPNPSELLGSAAFAGVLDQLRASYDTVIVDSAPLLPVADGAEVCRAADGALLIARYGSTTAESLSRAREALDRVGARTLGVVLNAMPLARTPQGYSYNYRDKVEEASVGELLH